MKYKYHMTVVSKCNDPDLKAWQDHKKSWGMKVSDDTILNVCTRIDEENNVSITSCGGVELIRPLKRHKYEPLSKSRLECTLPKHVKDQAVQVDTGELESNTHPVSMQSSASLECAAPADTQASLVSPLGALEEPSNEGE